MRSRGVRRDAKANAIKRFAAVIAAVTSLGIFGRSVRRGGGIWSISTLRADQPQGFGFPDAPSRGYIQLSLGPGQSLAGSGAAACGREGGDEQRWAASGTRSTFVTIFRRNT